MSDKLQDEFLTVAEAARRMKIDPKQVRRYAGKLRTQDRTPLGHVPLRVRLSALIALRDDPIREGGSQKDIGQDKDRTPGRTGQDTPTEEDAGAGSLGTVPAVLYQHRIADLEARNAELRADKERLYGLLETAQANLAREQALRSLPPPEQAQIAPTVVEVVETEAAITERAVASESVAVGSKKPGRWAKLKKWFSAS